MRTMIWKSIATLIPCFVMLVGIMPISALAATMEDNVVGNTVDEIDADDLMDKNQGTVTVNNGELNHNYGTITNNNGEVLMT